MTIYEFMTILDMQTDASAKVMNTLCIDDNQPYYWGVFIGIAPLSSINKIVYFFKSILFISLNLWIWSTKMV